jgi:hypothetical protein
MLGHRAVHGFLHRLAQKAGAVLLAQERQGHPALPEALHRDLGLRLGELLVHLGIKLGGGDRDLVAALQAVVQGLGDLHRVPHVDVPPGGGRASGKSAAVLGRGGRVASRKAARGPVRATWP